MRIVCSLVCCLALALTSGCSRPAPNDRAAPEAAFSAFRAALSSGSPDAVWSFLDAPTRDALTARAEAAREAGAAVAHPAQLVLTGWVPDEADIDALRRIEDTEDSVTLEIETVQGETSTFELHRGEDGWRVYLPIDAAPAEDADAAPEGA